MIAGRSGELTGFISRRTRFDSGLRYHLALVAIMLIVFVTHAVAADAIPTYSLRYRAAVERAAGAQFGLDAPVARIAAQIHAESGWRPKAASAYAQGLAQFTPETAKWLPSVCPEVGEPDPWDAAWSIRAVACYDHYLYTRVGGTTECDQWAFTLSSYNGGLEWLRRDQQRASAYGADPARWFSSVELRSARSAAARAENRDYVRRILLDLEPIYIDAGWAGVAVCL